VATLVDRLKVAEKEIERMRRATAQSAAGSAAAGAERVGKVRVVLTRLPSEAKERRQPRRPSFSGGDIRGKLGAEPAGWR